jgi:multidrug efflux pump subunit AcrA (membrane-fusion protein)
MSASGNHDLFRKEVLDARRQSWLGNISLAQPLRWGVLAAVAVALAAAVLCMLFFGTYAARARVVGDLVPAGATVARLQARLSVPSRAIGFIAPGDRILLRYRAFPYQTFGHQVGRVASISPDAIAPAGAAGNSGQVYRVLVDLQQQAITARGKSRPLRPGMLLDADILGERRRLYEWILKPRGP